MYVNMDRYIHIIYILYISYYIYSVYWMSAYREKGRLNYATMQYRSPTNHFEVKQIRFTLFPGAVLDDTCSPQRLTPHAWLGCRSMAGKSPALNGDLNWNTWVINITQPWGIWSIMATIRWCPIYPKWDIYQSLEHHLWIDKSPLPCFTTGHISHTQAILMVFSVPEMFFIWDL